MAYPRVEFVPSPDETYDNAVDAFEEACDEMAKHYKKYDEFDEAVKHEDWLELIDESALFDAIANEDKDLLMSLVKDAVFKKTMELYRKKLIVEYAPTIHDSYVDDHPYSV